ncbi:cAMP-dependent protein kinase regulatory subunit [Trema orientale]|uniref:cAMP-dependent protein kinase regulatory subunit n=1 Tax=Trema orientale TaxID=63057 RepID=A0A2P5F498_TREOI|nr:cAMP-dependent protein kinase regulatory subunit [Trema orientale]
MQRVEVQPWAIVVKQGGEGDCFYVVGSGEFEVFATQEENNGEVPRVLHRYTADKLSSFGELALIIVKFISCYKYNKPLQAYIRAVTSGTLWALRREDFRGILMSEFSNLSSLKLLRSVYLLSRLTILQLSHIADSLSEVSFSHGQSVVKKNEGLSALYIIQKRRGSKELSVEKTEGRYFGEWTLLGEYNDSISAVAIGDVICAVLTKENFESAVGPLRKLSQDDQKSRDHSSEFSKESAKNVDISSLTGVQLSDIEWKKCVYSTDCSEIGLVHLRESGEMPFGSWRESELDTFAKIAKGQLNLPQTFSVEVVDLITKVMRELFFIFSFLQTCLQYSPDAEEEMAETFLTPIIESLIQLLTDQVKSLKGFEREVESLKTELSILQSLLKDADAREDRGEFSDAVKAWVKQLRQEADRILMNIGGMGHKALMTSVDSSVFFAK